MVISLLLTYYSFLLISFLLALFRISCKHSKAFDAYVWSYCLYRKKEEVNHLNLRQISLELSKSTHGNRRPYQPNSTGKSNLNKCIPLLYFFKMI